MIGPSYHLFHLSNYHMFIEGINWLLSAIQTVKQFQVIIQQTTGDEFTWDKCLASLDLPNYAKHFIPSESVTFIRVT